MRVRSVGEAEDGASVQLVMHLVMQVSLAGSISWMPVSSTRDVVADASCRS